MKIEVVSDVVCPWCYFGVSGAQPPQALAAAMREAATS